MMSFFKNLFKQRELDYEVLMGKGAVIVDVRTPQEFAQGHVKGSVNIPLGNIQSYIVKLKRQNKPVIACCRSGARSGSAASILNNAGVESYNGGSWNEVESGLKNLKLSAKASDK